MRVGLYLTATPAEQGGGFTFEEDVYLSLLRSREQSRHEFVAIVPDAGTAGRSQPRLESLPLSSPANTVERIGTRALRGALRLIGAGSGVVRPWPARALERLAARHRLDLIVSLSPAVPVLDVPFVTVVWDLQHRLQPFFPEVSTGREWALREQHFGSTLRRAAAIITGTEVGRQEIQTFYGVPPERVHILPHPTPRFALEAGEADAVDVVGKYGLQENYLLYPAQFWPHKNHVGILRAVRILADQHGRPCSVVFVGSDKGNRAHVEQVARDLGLGDRVKILGFVPRADLVSLYRRAFALLYLSYFGPENLPPLEAFALGCPVIAADVAGAREQLGEAALLVAPRQPAAAAAAVVQLQTDGALRNTLIERGRQRAQQFTGLDFVRELFRVLDSFAAVRDCWPS